MEVTEENKHLALFRGSGDVRYFADVSLNIFQAVTWYMTRR